MVQMRDYYLWLFGIRKLLFFAFSALCVALGTHKKSSFWVVHTDDVNNGQHWLLLYSITKNNKYLSLVVEAKTKHISRVYNNNNLFRRHIVEPNISHN